MLTGPYDFNFTEEWYAKRGIPPLRLNRKLMSWEEYHGLTGSKADLNPSTTVNRDMETKDSPSTGGVHDLETTSVEQE